MAGIPIAPVLSLVGSLVSSAMAPEPPQPQAPPPPPAPAPAPPAPTVSTAPEVSGEEPVIDAEAARVRAQKRRKAAEDQRLFSLQEDDSVVLTKSLLGE